MIRYDECSPSAFHLVIWMQLLWTLLERNGYLVYSWWVVTGCHQCFIFPRNIGFISSSQLTNSIIFSEGWVYNHQPALVGWSFHLFLWFEAVNCLLVTPVVYDSVKINKQLQLPHLSSLMCSSESRSFESAFGSLKRATFGLISSEKNARNPRGNRRRQKFPVVGSCWQLINHNIFEIETSTCGMKPCIYLYIHIDIHVLSNIYIYMHIIMINDVYIYIYIHWDRLYRRCNCVTDMHGGLGWSRLASRRRNSWNWWRGSPEHDCWRGCSYSRHQRHGFV